MISSYREKYLGGTIKNYPNSPDMPKLKNLNLPGAAFGWLFKHIFEVEDFERGEKWQNAAQVFEADGMTAPKLQLGKM